jgi:hypothetical protein
MPSKRELPNEAIDVFFNKEREIDPLARIEIASRTKEPRKEGTKEERKEPALESIYLPTFKPVEEERKKQRTIPSNVEVWPDQEEAIEDYIYHANKRLGRKYTKKQIIIEALDDWLTKKFKELR